MSERIEVEVECRYPLGLWQGIESCPQCAGGGVVSEVAATGSVTEALLRLGLAAEAWNGLTLTERVDTTAWGRMRDAYEQVTALRAAKGA